MLKRLLLASVFSLAASSAFAQIAGYRVVSTCGDASPWSNQQAGQSGFSVWLSVDPTMTLCTTGGGGGMFTWPGTASPTTYGTGTPTGTVPAVNAAVTNANQNVSSNAIEPASPIVPILQSLGGINGFPATYAAASSVVSVGASPLHTAQLMLLDCFNPNATVEYIQAWDGGATGSANCNSAAPPIIKCQRIGLGIPAGAHVGYSLSGIGIQFLNGLTLQPSDSFSGATWTGVSALACNVGYTFT